MPDENGIRIGKEASERKITTDMYARTTQPRQESIPLPSNYAGTAFRDAPPETEEAVSTEEYINASTEDISTEQACLSPKEERRGGKTSGASVLSRLFGGGGLSSLLDVLSPKAWLNIREGRTSKGESMPLDTEDIMLLMLAAFLFFSEDGDKICALILLALLIFA